MNILFVGFGGMGCRHAQSFLNKGHQLFVVEPITDLYLSNLGRINADAGDFKRVGSIDEIKEQIDFAVVATPAEPRFAIVQQLLEKNIKAMLLEKVVFQSVQQFEEVSLKLNEKGAKAYCNFVNRYFPQYLAIQKSLTNKESAPIQMHIRGGDFGLGCNGLHYLDLFEYFTDQKSIDYTSQLIESSLGNKRGSQYKEVNGTIVCRTLKNDIFTISSLPSKKNGVEITVSTPTGVHIFDEEDQTYSYYDFKEQSIKTEQFVMLPSSKLTYTIFEDMMANRCLLPTVTDTFNAHSNFFKVLNATLVGETLNSTICPIT